jgi:NAD(P)H-dependent flavin oxidoreductase YrpB (nitropropane dioxygenase family)
MYFPRVSPTEWTILGIIICVGVIACGAIGLATLLGAIAFVVTAASAGGLDGGTVALFAVVGALVGTLPGLFLSAYMIRHR